MFNGTLQETFAFPERVIVALYSKDTCNRFLLEHSGDYVHLMLPHPHPARKNRNDQSRVRNSSKVLLVTRQVPSTCWLRWIKSGLRCWPRQHVQVDVLQKSCRNSREQTLIPQPETWSADTRCCRKASWWTACFFGLYVCILHAVWSTSFGKRESCSQRGYLGKENTQC